MNCILGVTKSLMRGNVSAFVLITQKLIKKFKYHYFVTPNETMDLGNDRQGPFTS